jgi:hypothetical protein
MDDKSATREQRVAAFEQLKRWARRRVPRTGTLCKLLNRRDSSPVSYTAFGRDVAMVLGSIGPDAARAAIAAIRTEWKPHPRRDRARLLE